MVKFTSSKGLVRGVVIGTKWSKRGMKVAQQFNTELRLKGVKHQVAEGQEVYEVADFVNGVIWTTSQCFAVGKATKSQIIKGKELKAKITINKNEVKRDRTSKNLRKQDENNIARLNRGDAIEIKYVGGCWKKEKFSHYLNSGKIAFYSSSAKRGVRYAWPSGVRKAK